MEKINNRGQVGMDTAKSVMLALLVLGVIAFVTIVALANLNDTNVAKESSGLFTVSNETLTLVNQTGVDVANGNRPDVSCSFTSINAQNGTGAVVQTYEMLGDAANVTVSNCNVLFPSANGDSHEFNNTAWNVTYTYKYNTFSEVSQNLTGGTSDFFGNASTWFALLAVVIIILIIAIVIFAVNRFGGNRVALG